MTTEYAKADLDLFDPSISLFSYFGYRPYTSTGTFATANLLTNATFETDTSGWSVDADLGLAPTLSHLPVGTYSGGSVEVTPVAGSPDRNWLTHDASISISTGQTFLITGYTKAATGSINLRAFLHQSGDRSIVYSDRIAETYATNTGRTFSFYLRAGVTASDVTISFETDNQDIAYEIDELSLRRMNTVLKNTTANEIHILTNTGASSQSFACPG